MKNVFSNKLGIRSLSGTAIVAVLDGRLDISDSADPQNPFVIHYYVMIPFQVISNPSIPFVRVFGVDLFDFLCNSEIFTFRLRNLSMKPFIVCSSGYFSKFTEFCDRIFVLFVFFFDCLIDLIVSQSA